MDLFLAVSKKFPVPAYSNPSMQYIRVRGYIYSAVPSCLTRACAHNEPLFHTLHIRPHTMNPLDYLTVTADRMVTYMRIVLWVGDKLLYIIHEWLQGETSCWSHLHNS